MVPSIEFTNARISSLVKSFQIIVMMFSCKSVPAPVHVRLLCSCAFKCCRTFEPSKLSERPNHPFTQLIAPAPNSTNRLHRYTQVYTLPYPIAYFVPFVIIVISDGRKNRGLPSSLGTRGKLDEILM